MPPAGDPLRPHRGAVYIAAVNGTLPQARSINEGSSMFVTPAYAQAAGAPGGADSFLLQLLPLVLIFVIFYFLLIRPQQKRAKEHKMMIDNLRRGDQVILAGGIYGKVTKVQGDDEADIEIAEGIKVKVVKSTVAQVVSKTEPANDG